MNKELIDRTWACLPRESKEVVKRRFQLTDADCIAYDILTDLFGIHNLTSAAEGENVNLSQSSSNCDKEFDNILRDSFSKERRLNIAAMAMQGILANSHQQNVDMTIGQTVELAISMTDALIAEIANGSEK